MKRLTDGGPADMICAAKFHLRREHITGNELSVLDLLLYYVE